MEWKYGNHVIYYEEGNEVLAKLTYEVIEDGVVNIDHTFVSEKLRGMGVASKLMTEAMRFFNEKGYRVKASCSYAHQWIKKHEEYKELAAEDFDDSILQCKIMK